MAKLHGKAGAIYLGGAIGVGTKVTNKTEWAVQLNRDYVDATVFGETNKTYLAGLRNFQGTYSGLLDTAGDDMLDASALDEQLIYLYADDGTTGGSVKLVAHGSGFIDANVSTSSTDAVRISGEFRAQGNWTIDL
jgi:hypothetical protein